MPVGIFTDARTQTSGVDGPSSAWCRPSTVLRAMQAVLDNPSVELLQFIGINRQGVHINAMMLVSSILPCHTLAVPSLGAVGLVPAGRISMT
jgi:hypothetical protein